MSGEDGSNASITVKAPDGRVEDVRLQLSEGMRTVADLKAAIELEYPTRPLASDQKLIYNGRLMQNDQVLSDLLVCPC